VILFGATVCEKEMESDAENMPLSQANMVVVDNEREYKRPLSNAEIVPKFSIEATINEALSGVKHLKYEDGDVMSMDSITKYDNFVIDWRDIQTFESVNDVIYLLKQYSDQIYGVRFPGCRLNESSIDQIMSVICDHGLLKYLVDIDLSYISLSVRSVKQLSQLLDPAVSGYCPLKRMQLCHCNLKQFGMQAIFEACKTNVFLNEMNFSGNNCSDTACTAIAKCLENPENRFVSLALGDNNISVAGLRLLCPGLSRHVHLRALLLSSNYIGDEGASMLLRALKKSSCLEELNISNCGLALCKWAKHLKYLSNLASLNVSCNEIGDFGGLSICNGVQTCPCLRHLDLSNNRFGGITCSGLGSLLELQGGLYSLNVSYNTHIDHQIWRSMAAGLSLNKTLILLDCRWCNMTFADAGCLCEALEVNEVCSIDFSFNPVPERLFTDCRSICPELKRSFVPLNGPQPPASPGSRMGTAGSRSSKRSEALATPMIPTVPSTPGSPTSRPATGVPTTPSRKTATGASNPQVIKPLPLHDECQLISLRNADKWREDCAAQLSILLALQQYDTEGLKRDVVVDEEEEDGLEALMKDEYVRVVYGHVGEEIGVIKIHASTTYAQAKPLITPLIKEYMGAAAVSEDAHSSESMRALLQDFTFILKTGERLDGVSLQVRNKMRCYIVSSSSNYACRAESMRSPRCCA
jgi:hypothetical protein